MEPPSPSAGMPGTPASTAAPSPGPRPAPPPGYGTSVPTAPLLPVVARADRRLVAGAAAGGISLDVAARAGLPTIAGTACVLVAAGALLLSGRVRGLVARTAVACAAAFGLVLTFRASPWVIVPVTASIVALLLLGASLGADCGGLRATFPVLGSRMITATGHLAAAPGMLAGPPGSRARRVLAAGRGVLIGGPAIVAVCWLLTTANPVFRSWFDLAPLARHALLIAIGAWTVLGLGRAASAARPVSPSPQVLTLSPAEACVITGGLGAVYAAFTVAQLEALSGAGHRILVTRGLTYAQYARGGFFQLLACAAITLAVLLSVRACSRPYRPLLTALCAVTIALTLGVVFSAISRLDLYEAAFGLTLLRLACLAAACWIAVVFLLLAATLPRRGLGSRYFPAAMVISGLMAVTVWAIVNPAGIVARTDVDRARGGRPLDVSQLVGLGPDAVPALAAALPSLNPADAAPLRQALCARRPVSAGGTALNVSQRSANGALARLCGTAFGPQ